MMPGGGKAGDPPPSLMGEFSVLMGPSGTMGSGSEQTTGLLLPLQPVDVFLHPQQQQQQQQQLIPQQALPLWPPAEAGPWPDLAGAAAAAAAAPTPSWLEGSVTYAGRLDPQAMAAKLAAAREKNRLAQRRFRERQRAKARTVDDQAEELQRQLDELAVENAELQHQGRIYQKVLAVRDAMLETFAALRPADQPAPPLPQQAQQLAQQEPAGQPPAAPAATAEAARDFVRALDELPSEGELDAAAAAADAATAQAQQAQQAEGQHVPGWSSLLPRAHSLGASGQLDGSALRQVEAIPAVDSASVKAQVMAMTEPEHLLDYYRQWQAELSVSYQAAEAAGFDEASVAEVTAVQDRMVQMWWHISELRPAYVCFLTHAALPEDSARLPLWREIAADMLPQMSEASRVILRRAWLQYSKRLARIAVGVSRWVRMLQAYTVREPAGLVTNAQHMLELVEITRHLADAVQEEYVASMEFVAEQSKTTSDLQKARINALSCPFMPDLVAINYHLLCMDAAERGRSKDGSLPASLLVPTSASATAHLGGPPPA